MFKTLTKEETRRFICLPIANLCQDPDYRSLVLPYFPSHPSFKLKMFQNVKIVLYDLESTTTVHLLLDNLKCIYCTVFQCLPATIWLSLLQGFCFIHAYTVL